MKWLEKKDLTEEAGESILRTGGLYIGDIALKKTMKHGIGLPTTVKGGGMVFVVNYIGGCVIRLLQENDMLPKKLFGGST